MRIKVDAHITKRQKKQLIQKLGYNICSLKKMFEDLGYKVGGNISIGLLRNNDIICWKNQEDYILLRRIIYSLTLTLTCAGCCTTCSQHEICAISRKSEELYPFLENSRLEVIFKKHIETTIKEQLQLF